MAKVVTVIVGPQFRLKRHGESAMKEDVLIRRLYHLEAEFAQVADGVENIDAVVGCSLIQQVPEGDKSAGTTDAGAAVDHDG